MPQPRSQLVTVRRPRAKSSPVQSCTNRACWRASSVPAKAVIQTTSDTGSHCDSIHGSPSHDSVAISNHSMRGEPPHLKSPPASGTPNEVPDFWESAAQSYRGYSPDRVVADPELNAQFVDHCQRLGLLGNARVWNTLLFGLRKAGKLVDFPTTERTLVSWEECDNYLFASEIAFEAMLRKAALSLDEILCDPSLAARFDELAARFAPGYRPFQYRWAALKLRKQAKLARSRGLVLKVPSKLQSPILLDGLSGSGLSQIEELSDAPGIYLVTGDGDEALYIGETVSLKKRLLKN